MQGYVGQATRLSYRWNPCGSSTINSHLSASGLWGILSALQSGVHPTGFQLADLALAYAVARQRASFRPDPAKAAQTAKSKKRQPTDDIAEHVSSVGGVWLFVLHSYEREVSDAELDRTEALWVNLLRTTEPQRGLNQPGRTKVFDVVDVT